MTKQQITELLTDGRFEDSPIKGRLIETHISWVIITRVYAFKIKKPVQYSFLDFSTLKKRKFYCERELELNKSLAGDMYLDILPIRQLDHHVEIGGNQGTIVDYALRMKRMSIAKQMNILLEKGQVDTNKLYALAEKIAAFHLRAKVINTDPDLREMERDFNDLSSVKDFVSENLGSEFADMIEHAVARNRKFLKEHGALVKKRAREGYVRECHGDLHSRNIFLYKNPVIFDCIEFNDHFRQIDVLNEIAFFCMDLESFGTDRLSQVFLDTYLRLLPCAQTEEEVTLFIYYKAYRANVRAKVNALRAMSAKNDSEKRHKLTETKKYLRLMERYCSLL
jgi:hypothetical protein